MAAGATTPITIAGQQGTGTGGGKFPAEQVQDLLEATAPGKWKIVPGHTRLTGSGPTLNGTVMIEATGGNCSHHTTKYLSIENGVLKPGFSLQTPWMA
jgi:hypothetical protein